AVHPARLVGAESGEAVPRAQAHRPGGDPCRLVHHCHLCRYAVAVGIFRSAVHHSAVSSVPPNRAPDWDEIRLVVFDVDGTLYDQRGLRLCMAREMLLAAVKGRGIDFIRILSAYRRIREELGDSLHEDFEQELTSRTAASVGCSEERVRSTAGEWLER